MSSLYDQYHSKENINHIYKLLCEILKVNYNISLNTINNYNEYMNNLSIIFANTESDNLTDFCLILFNLPPPCQLIPTIFLPEAIFSYLSLNIPPSLKLNKKFSCNDLI